MDIYDEISAERVEKTDQIIVDGDPIEVTSVDDDLDDILKVFISGYSHESGDAVKYHLDYDKMVQLWAV